MIKSELDRLCDLLDERGIEHLPTNTGIELRLAGMWCFANEARDGSGLFVGYGFMPWMCCTRKNAVDALRWLNHNLGFDVS